MQICIQEGVRVRVKIQVRVGVRIQFWVGVGTQTQSYICTQSRVLMHGAFSAIAEHLVLAISKSL